MAENNVKDLLYNIKNDSNAMKYFIKEAVNRKLIKTG